jgi:hypothetical protein
MSYWTKKHKIWLNALWRDLTGPLQTAFAVGREHLKYLEMKLNVLDAGIERYALQPPHRGYIETAWNNRHSPAAIKAQRWLSRLFYHSIRSLKRSRSTLPNPYHRKSTIFFVCTNSPATRR